MGDSSVDRAARLELLESWAGEHRQINDPSPRGPSRVRQWLWRMQYRLAAASQRLADRVLERGLDTAGSTTEPEHEHPDRVRYVPSDWHVVPRALRYLGVAEDDVFVDFGCGKGRVVHQAAKRPFRRVIGVEISPALADIARANLAAHGRQHRCRNIEIVVCDAADYQVPDDLTIAYFYAPFKAATFDAVLRGIIDSMDRRPRPVRLIYLLPTQKSAILATERFRLVMEQRSSFLDVPGPPAAIFESL